MGILRANVVVTLLLFVAFGFGAKAQAEVVAFNDDFNSGPSPLWGNEVGAWSAAGGVYNATLPSGAPPFRYSSLPYQLSDFSFQVDMNDIGDGGIWLRSADNLNGVLLITGGDGFWDNGGSPQKGKDLYWHVFVNGVGSPPGYLSRVENVFDPGVTDATLRVDVSGDTFKAYVNDVLISTLIDGTFATGKVALYDAYGAQSFDNVILNGTAVPEPATLGLLALGSIGLLATRSARKRRTE